MKEKTYFISAVAGKYNIHPQTLRLYEREGLLVPSRSKGNTRMFSDEDLKKLEFILNLTREMGVNLAGIEIILNMKDKMEKMQRDFAQFLETLKTEFFVGREELFEQKRQSALVKFESPPVAPFTGPATSLTAWIDAGATVTVIVAGSQFVGFSSSQIS